MRSIRAARLWTIRLRPTFPVPVPRGARGRDLKRSVEADPTEALFCNFLLIAFGAEILLLWRGPFDSNMGWSGRVSSGRRNSSTNRDWLRPDGSQRFWDLCDAGAWTFSDGRVDQCGRKSSDVAVDDLFAPPPRPSRTGYGTRRLWCGRVAGLSAVVARSRNGKEPIRLRLVAGNAISKAGGNTVVRIMVTATSFSSKLF